MSSLGVVEPLHPRDLVRPRLRGWLHLWAAPVSLVAGIVLVVAGAHHRIPLTVYAASIVGLFTTSALYHRITWTPRARRRMKRLDHSMIFIFIAGSYTAYASVALSPHTSRPVLVIIWAGAALGVAFRLLWPGAPRWLVAPVYIALGWAAVFVLPGILHGGGVTALVLLCVGGLLYSLGAVAYASRRPNPRPHVFGYHEVFHLCTVVAAAAHYIGIWFALY